MPGETKHGIECTQFEALISDALEGRLTAALQQSFEAHRQTCELCGPLVADVQAGQQWLQSLEPVEPPVNLVHNILATTTGVASTRPQAVAVGERSTPLGERLREWWDSFFTPLTGFVRQPRFVMSFGMAFFSFSLALSVAGFKPSDVAKIDLRPAALRHAYVEAQIWVVKRYDNIRFVYEIESRVRELKRANTPAEPSPEPQKENRKNNTSGQPEQRQDRNYSCEENLMVLAGMTEETTNVRSFELHAASYGPEEARSSLPVRSATPPVETVTTNRRFV